MKRQSKQQQQSDTSSANTNSHSPSSSSTNSTTTTTYSRCSSLDEEDASTYGSSETYDYWDEELKGSRGTFRKMCDGDFDLLMTAVVFSAGFNCIWRFPYICYRNGGGAFLVAYSIFHIIAAFPLLFMENCLGQFSSLSSINIWQMCPIFKSAGLTMVFVSVLQSVSNNSPISWSLNYLVLSLSRTLPWNSCSNEWNTLSCIDDQYKTVLNISGKPVTASEQFWLHHLLSASTSYGVQWQLFFALVITSYATFILVVKGEYKLGKLGYFIPIFSIGTLCTICAYIANMPGAMEGMQHYFLPKLADFLEPQLWSDAAVQSLYSLGVTLGFAITYSSYKPIGNSCIRDSVIIATASFIVSILAGCMVFSCIGFVSFRTGLQFMRVFDAGPGLLFVSFTEAAKYFAKPQLWSLIFFSLIFCIGLCTQFCLLETLSTSLVEAYAGEETLVNRPHFVLSVASTIFIISTFLTSKSSLYLLQIIDWYSYTITLPILGIIQCVAVGWIYGIDVIYQQLQLMLGYKLSCVWKVFWNFITPAALITSTISSAYSNGLQFLGISGTQPNLNNYGKILGTIICIICLIMPLSIMILAAALGRITSTPDSEWEEIVHEMKIVNEEIRGDSSSNDPDSNKSNNNDNNSNNSNNNHYYYYNSNTHSKARNKNNNYRFH